MHRRKWRVAEDEIRDLKRRQMGKDYMQCWTTTEGIFERMT